MGGGRWAGERDGPIGEKIVSKEDQTGDTNYYKVITWEEVNLAVIIINFYKRRCILPIYNVTSLINQVTSFSLLSAGCRLVEG